MPKPQSVQSYGFNDMNAKMDAHVKREDKRTQPRRTQNGRDARGKFDSSGHRPVTRGVRVKRAETVVYPYGGKPYETIVRPQRAKAQWKNDIEAKRDQIGQRVARETSATRPGCALLVVRATEATAMRYKLQAAMTGGQVRDRLNANATSPLYRTRTTRVLETLDYAIATGRTVTLGVYTRAELNIIGSQRLKAKHITRHVRTLESKLAGNH